ncbi:MAG: hypothetical protein ACRDE7_14715 [Sphingobacterium sp.]
MKVLTAFLIGFLLVGCSSNKVGSKSINLEGNWRWVEKSGGYAGRTTTPETTNEEIHLQITKDSIFYYNSGELVSQQSYELIQTQSLLDKKNYWSFKGSDPKVLLEKTNNLLIIREDCYDCFTNKYEKIDEGK